MPRSGRRACKLLACAIAISAVAFITAPWTQAAAADPTGEFRALVDESWDADMRADPLWATQAGDNRFNDQLPDVSIAAIEKHIAAKRQLSQRLQKLDRAALPPSEQVNYDILTRLIADDLAEAKFKTYLMPITNREGFHTEFPDLYKRVPMLTVRDYENYIARLRGFAKLVDQNIELMQAGIDAGMVLPAVVLKGYRETLEPHIVADPKQSLCYAPLVRMPNSFTSDEQERLRAAGQQAIAESIVPGYRKFLHFMETKYVPAAPGTIGASHWPDGRELYRHRIRKFTTLNLTPEEVHQKGLDEVKRIHAEMEEVVRRAKFKGSVADFIQFLRTDPQFYAKTPEELVRHVGLICKRIDGQLPTLFSVLPRTPYGIREIPDYIAPKTTSAFYRVPGGDGASAGFYYLNTFNLKSRPLYEMEALSLHESVPGHHLQLALQQEMTDLPKFRRYHGFTVFVEGWGLYSERLGLEMGFYRDPYTDFGRLTFEMWRACRLVVDTGIHYMGWSRQQAIDYMAENTALSMHNIAAEVDRYISWPGQAVAYKIGELKIRELRALAEKNLGRRFDVREFHRVVLGSGSVPLSVLESNVQQYISQNKGDSTASSQAATPTTSASGPHASTDGAGKTSGLQRGVWKYPSAHRGDQVDDYHGTKIADPYRWLEEADSAETKAWVAAENDVTFGYLKKLPQREPLRRRLTELWNFERYSAPAHRGGRYFFERNDGLQNQGVLYVAKGLNAEPRVLIDPNTFSNDGTVALAATAISEDGKLIAYATSGGGSDWREWHVRDVDTGKDRDDRIEWSKFSGAAWSPKNDGFFYSRFDAPKEGEVLTGSNYFQKLYFHKLGDPQSKDELVYERRDHKDWGFNADVSEDERFLIVHVSRGSEHKNGLFYRDLQKPGSKFVELLVDFDAEYDFLGNDGSTFWIRTDNGAERSRVIAIDLEHSDKQHWREIIPQAKETLVSANIVADRFVASYLKDAYSAVRVFDLTGKHERDVQLPGIGTAGGFGGRRKDKETFYAFSSYTAPPTVYRYDPATGESTVYRKPKVAFDSEQYTTEQVFCTSKDGTRVPIFVSYKKGLKRDGHNPTVLYAYGGFNIPLTPSF
jgi:uncharacterized protein (DUF885 family)